MNLWLGVRMAFAGGREGAVRMALMAGGIAIGVVLVLFPLTAMPVQQAHIDRLAWHRTDPASPATAPDPALWLPVTDRYAGQDVIRVQVAALGPQPPVPPAWTGCPARARWSSHPRWPGCSAVSRTTSSGTGSPERLSAPSDPRPGRPGGAGGHCRPEPGGDAKDAPRLRDPRHRATG
jgi:hypothetical protein